jgi:hypothetical protein
MLYLLFGLITIVIILFITAKIQSNSYLTKFENFTISSIGNIRDKIKLKSRDKIISTIKYKINKKKEIEDVQYVDNSDIYQYLD